MHNYYDLFSLFEQGSQHFSQNIAVIFHHPSLSTPQDSCCRNNDCDKVTYTELRDKSLSLKAEIDQLYSRLECPKVWRSNYYGSK
jgi:hypothetical protein